MSGISCGLARSAHGRTLNPPRDIAIRKRVSNVGEATAGNYRIIPIEFPWGWGTKKEGERKKGERKELKRFTSFFPFVFRLFLFFFFFFRWRQASRAFCLNHTPIVAKRRARISQREITKLRIPPFSLFFRRAEPMRNRNWVEIKWTCLLLGLRERQRERGRGNVKKWRKWKELCVTSLRSCTFCKSFFRFAELLREKRAWKKFSFVGLIVNIERAMFCMIRTNCGEQFSNNTSSLVASSRKIFFRGKREFPLHKFNCLFSVKVCQELGPCLVNFSQWNHLSSHFADINFARYILSSSKIILDL